MTVEVATEGSSSQQLEVIPALFEHATSVYEEMTSKASWDDELSALIWEGHLTNLFRKLRLSVPYYTQIKNQLMAMGCIEQLRRGGGSGMSRWVLWKKPELGLWKTTDPVRSSRGNKIAQQDQQIRALAERVTALESQIGVLIAERVKWSKG